MDRLKDLDINLSYFVYKNYPRSDNYQQLLSFLEWSCHGVPWFVGVIIGIYLCPSNALMSHLLAGLFLDVLAVAIIKASVRRRRPTYANQNNQLIVASVDKHSMPSGHTSRAVYIALLLNNGSFWSQLIWIWSIAVGLSRIAMGRHHIMDVIAGFSLAFIIYNLQFSFDGFLNKFVVWALLSQFRATKDLSAI